MLERERLAQLKEIEKFKTSSNEFFMGKEQLQKIKDWTTHFTLSDKNHNLSDGRRFEFLPKEKFQDPTDLFNSLLRGADDAV